MKLFIDISTRRFVKSSASSAALPTLVLKRRDIMPVEVVFVQRGAAVATPAGTTSRVALKSKFSDANFLALADSGTLDLYTTAVEDLFPGSTASADALLEVRYTRTGEATRTATLQVEIQNSVILGTEGTPATIPDGKATQAEATAGTSNEKWMTPLRTAQAIAQLAPPPTWASILNKPATFAPSAHTHLKSEITGLDADLAALATEDTALGQRIDFLAANLDPAALDSIAEAAAAINTLQSEIDGKATAAQGALADTALQPEPVDYQGAYNNGADYSPGQVVSFNGELYRRVGEPNPGYPPPGSYWAAFDPSASPAFKLWVDLSKADTVHTHTASQITDFASAVVAVSPPVDWSSLTGKPSTFAPSAHTHPATEITGLTDFIIAAAPGLQINTTVRIGDGTTTTFPIDGLVSSDPEHVLVALNGVTQTPGTDYTVSEATGTITFDSAPASGMQISCTALGLRTVQPPIDPTLYLYAFDQSANGLTTYSGRLLNADRPAAPALPETATSWTIRRSTLSAAGRILATASAVGAWANRETLVYA
jgi:hypothetical protein